MFLSSKMKCNQSLTDTNILSAKRKKKSRLNFAFNGLWENKVGEFVNHLKSDNLQCKMLVRWADGTKGGFHLSLFPFKFPLIYISI